MTIKRPISKQPIPSHATLVFHGNMFDVYQWKQKLFNGEKAVFEKIKRADTVSVIPITPEGKILVGSQEQPGTMPFVGSFGGRIDENEEPLTAARRELLEETGYEAKDYVLWHAVQPIEKIDWAIYIFVAKGCRKIAEQTLDAGEKIQIHAVSFDEFVTMSLKESFRDTEIALKIARALQSPQRLVEIKRLLSR